MVESIKQLGEFGVIADIRRAAHPRRAWVETGIGDDCAVLKLPGDQRLLVTTDMLIDRVHFLKGTLTPAQLGYKCMAVNLSDIAAMGGEPQAAFLAMGLTADLDRGYLAALRDGVLRCADRYGVDLLGGDTVYARTDLVLCLTVLGCARASEVVRRTGARPGDVLMLGGRVGDSAAGLHLLLHEEPRLPEVQREALVQAHLQPQPQIALGRMLATQALVHAMIDVSDGVLQDLSHLCEEGGVGAEVDADALPLSEEARALARCLGSDARDWGLAGGEDYVLLFAVPADREAQARRLARDELGCELHAVGAVRARHERAGLWVRRDGVWSESVPRGYDAFREGLVER